jgi:hypothetical protein
MRVTLEITMGKEEPVFLARHGEIPVSFLAVRTIDLPFVPFPQLHLELPCKNDEDEDFAVRIERVFWSPAREVFTCQCVPYLPSSYSTSEDMNREAEVFERLGFEVEREGICVGEW